MLNPEAWLFDGRSAIGEEFDVSIDDIPASQSSLPSELLFCESVVITLPDTLHLPTDLQDLLSLDTESYCVRNFPLDAVTQSSFIENFIKNGKLVGVSIFGNSSWVISQGVLRLLLAREQCELLGLQGKPVPSNQPEKFAIAVDLKGRSKKSLEKLQKIFKKNVLTADILLNWEPHDAKICPSSLAAYLDNLGLVVSEEKVRLQEKIFYSVPSPKFGPTDVERAEEILDWMGSLASREPSLGKHPRVPETADENSDVIVYGQILQLTSLGLLLRSHIYSIMEKLQSMLEAEKVTWVGLQVLGYPDTSDPLGGQYKSEESVVLFLFPKCHWRILIPKCKFPP